MGNKKGIAPPRYDEKFKERAIRLVTEQGRPCKEVAAELGICIDTLRNWRKAAGVPSPGQADRQNRDAKKAREFCVDELCRILEVSRGGYNTSKKKWCCALHFLKYAWAKRSISRQKQRNQELAREVVGRHEAYPALGLDGLYHMVKQTIPCSRGGSTG